MIKKITNYLIVSAVLLSLNPAFADVVEEANNIKEEVNAASEQLLQSYLNDADISGKKKEIGARVLNKAKIKDADVEKFLNDPEVSVRKKSKMVQRLHRLADDAKAKYCKQKEESVQVDTETSAQAE